MTVRRAAGAVGMQSSPYNPCMLQSLQALLAPAVIERAVLMANHVLAAEPVATERLRFHAGRSIGLRWLDWPSMLPAPPVILFQITPAGLLESVPDRGADETADLAIAIDAGRPLALMASLAAGERLPMTVQGDAALAADVNWLVDNVRWDAEADLARFVDPRVAHLLANLGRGAVRSVQLAVRTGAGLAARWRGGRP